MYVNEIIIITNVFVLSFFFREPNSRVMKTIRTVTTTNRSGKPTVNRELNFDSPTLVSSVTHETRSRSRSPNYQKHIESQITRDVAYDSEPVLDISPTSTSKRTYNYSKTTERKTQAVPTPTYTTDIVEVNSTDLPSELKNLPISSDLLPGPGTKVTTTVRLITILLCRFLFSQNGYKCETFAFQVKTYTYEIPNDGKVPVNPNLTYKNEYYNSLNSSSTTNTIYPERDIPPVTTILPGTDTYRYRKETHNTVKSAGSPVPRYPEATPGTNQTYIYRKEVNETKNNVYGPPQPQPPPPVSTSLYHYERDVSNTNRTLQHPPGGIPPSYPPSNGTLPPGQPGQPGVTKYFYKKETNTKNTYGLPPDTEGYPPASPEPVYREPYRTPLPPTEPNTSTMYKYSSTTTNTTRGGGYPADKEPLRSPPFPTEGIVPVTQVDGPPKNLDKLLDTLGDVRIFHSKFLTLKRINDKIYFVYRMAECPLKSHIHHAKKSTQH